ncbi:uncharacterized protein LOC132710802 [Pantherophis guttatus]|uniref:Uncharacterized protein LOC132710802 n=1 Tax=Pantherophis guttatus TaxID=94885 RepID=A0ABM3Z6K1_PANGU|nr:uncharacterized protein LOC132710802 [Pantherophis guttatus]
MAHMSLEQPAITKYRLVASTGALGSSPLRPQRSRMGCSPIWKGGEQRRAPRATRGGGCSHGGGSLPERKAGRAARGFLGKKLQGDATTEEQKGVVVCKEKEGTDNGRRGPFIVQVRTIRDFLTEDGPSHLKMESEDEIHQCWDSQRQELLKRAARFPAAPSLLEEDDKDFLASLERVKEDLQEESSGKTRGEAVPQRDPNISGKAWMGREKLDFCMKVKMEEEVDLESQGALHLRQFILQDAEEAPQALEDTKLKSPKLEEEAFEIVKVKLP